MKTLKDFQGQKMNLNQMNSVFGGASSCTLVTETTAAHCKDENRKKYDDNGTLLSMTEQLKDCEPAK